MKGYIKIESATREGREGLSIETDLWDVSYMDRIVAVNGVCSALCITSTELKLIADLISSGFMEEVTDTVTLEDDTEVVRKPESGPSKKKKPNVRIIGGDDEGMLELLKYLLS